ncbi:hypothetical protein DFH07DRAFT_767188 [Mycena maculata]|uniref:Uncharacterized protein n=1 Tax=Mycena maculata TaxID=230809 RepID=A0AAD7NTY4_9AGAR|nr:hypothetical protein DFH07DRAFT_767188 [Mycena maculata]
MHMPQDSLEHIRIILEVRHKRLNLNFATTTGELPFYQEYTIPYGSSRVAFTACTILRDLALAEQSTLLDIFGDIISKWGGAVAANVVESRAKEKEFVDKYCREHDITTTICDIRKALASVDLLAVCTENLPAFAIVPKDEKSPLNLVAFHHRAEGDKDIFFFSPLLPRTESFLEQGLLSPENFQPGNGFDVITVCTAMAIVHEARRLVGTLI